MSGHTPGSWNFHERADGACAVVGPDGLYVAECSVRAPYNKTQKNNARLISAAPDLLAASKLFLEVRNPFYSGAVSEKEAEVMLEKAIARAEGRGVPK